MAKHEFGIMMDTPQQSKRYDEYEPWKYACISALRELRKLLEKALDENKWVIHYGI